ncbi:lipocalin Can f 6.0101-like [Myotis yumanensis]|uniref:lipocalin Can f 6.0101-like n=1 Tax=Myotis yumanensis TaxID=159337 RepID=UPI0038D3B217
MKLLLMCLGLTLVCAHHGGNHDVVTSNFDMSKISGEWYSILLASDVKEMIEENGSMRVFVESIQVLDNSSLSFKFHMKVNGECTEISFICDETEEKGVYSVEYDGYNTFHIIEAVYGDYLILYLSNVKNDEEAQVMEFYGVTDRQPDQGVDLGHVNVAELLHGLFELVLVGLDMHNEHKCTVVFYVLHR